MNPPPLGGHRVVVTRATHQASSLVAAFEEAGAAVRRLPLIEVTPPEDPSPLAATVRHADEFDWVVFTSANAVDAFLSRLPSPLEARVAVIGPATADAVRRHAIEPAVEARKSRAEGLIERLEPHLTPHDRVLIPQAEDARPELARGLRNQGVQVTRVTAYGKRLPSSAAAIAHELFADTPVGWVTVTSPRIARHLAALFGHAWQERRTEVRALSIGPVTSTELCRLGVEPAAEAASPSDEGLVAAMITASAIASYS